MNAPHVSPHRLGDVLLARQLITQAQLEAALEAQRHDNRRLGEILVEKRWLTQKQVKQALKWQSLLRAATVVASLTFAPVATAQADALFESTAFHLDDYKAVQGAHWSDESGRLQGLGISQLNGAGLKKDTALPAKPQLVEKLKADIKNALGTPMYTLFKGEYAAGADVYSKGMAYKAKWSKKGLAFEVKYQF